MFCEKGVLKYFTKFTGKHLCQSLFLKKLQASVCNYIKKENLAQASVYDYNKKENLAQVFSCEFCKILRTPLFIEHLRWLLLCFLLFLIMVSKEQSKKSLKKTNLSQVMRTKKGNDLQLLQNNDCTKNEIFY